LRDTCITNSQELEEEEEEKEEEEESKTHMQLNTRVTVTYTRTRHDVVFVFHATSNCSKEGIRVGKG
jgi:hypothetical protein